MAISLSFGFAARSVWVVLSMPGRIPITSAPPIDSQSVNANNHFASGDHWGPNSILFERSNTRGSPLPSARTVRRELPLSTFSIKVIESPSGVHVGARLKTPPFVSLSDVPREKSLIQISAVRPPRLLETATDLPSGDRAGSAITPGSQSGAAAASPPFRDLHTRFSWNRSAPEE